MDKDHYDMAATVFSPDGRVHQVEYSREAINRGGLAMGIRFKDGILFTIDKAIFSPLVEEEDMEKFFKITPTIGSAASGLIADARVLIDIMREKAQELKQRYGEDTDIRTLVDFISRIYEVYTRYEGVRPFGTSIIIGGKDNTGFHLYETDPSGVYQERKATAIGKGSKTAMGILEEKYDASITRDEALVLAFHILKETLTERPQDVPKGEEFHILTKKGFEVIDLDHDIDKVKELAIAEEEMSKSDHEDIDTILAAIEGINEKVGSVLKENFHDAEALKRASEKDLIALPGIGKATAGKILKALKDL